MEFHAISPQALTILGTYRCTAECLHCCFESNPRINTRLDGHDIEASIRRAVETFPTLKIVVFSGGECFLLGDDLVAAVGLASELGLSSRCVTNGFWAKSMNAGRRRLQKLQNAGLRELNISTGPFHKEWVSEETVTNAACLGVELGLPTLVMLEVVGDDELVTDNLLLRNPRLKALVDEEKVEVIRSPWMPMDAMMTLPQAPERLLNRRNVHLRGGCKSIFSTMVVTPKGDIGHCCGLSREKIPELNSHWGEDDDLHDLMVHASNDFMKIWLFVDGPEKILAWAATKDPSIDWEDRYAHHCQACLRLFGDKKVKTVLRNHYQERVTDVLMRYSVLLRQQKSLRGMVYG